MKKNKPVRSRAAPARRKVDPIQVSVLQRRLKSITEEMGLTLLRTTRSTHSLTPRPSSVRFFTAPPRKA